MKLSYSCFQYIDVVYAMKFVSYQLESCLGDPSLQELEFQLTIVDGSDATTQPRLGRCFFQV